MNLTDYHFIMKELVKLLKKKFTCLVENTERYITFTVSIKNEVTRIDKYGKRIKKNVSYILQFIDSARFMATSLPSLENNLSEGIHKIKCKCRYDDKKM